ncbi:MAG TPA: hypothetical protein VMW77_06635 [Methanoregula sp.]|nr:hypothetical protein [Methanoregula sp.]
MVLLLPLFYRPVSTKNSVASSGLSDIARFSFSCLRTIIACKNPNGRLSLSNASEQGARVR